MDRMNARKGSATHIHILGSAAIRVTERAANGYNNNKQTATETSAQLTNQKVTHHNLLGHEKNV